jgi:hypothetical protein
VIIGWLVVVENVIIYVNSSQLAIRNILTHSLLVFVYCLHPTDHFRILTKQEREGHETVDLLTEAGCFKGCELFAESIPGTVVQIFALLTTRGHIGWTKMFSLIVSIVVVAMTVSSIDTRKDSDVQNRSLLSDFYGFMPSNGTRRDLVRGAMGAMCLCQLLIKSCCYVLLYMISFAMPALFFCFEFGLFCLWKLANNDFQYWLPVEGKIGVGVTILCRLIAYSVGHFTSMVQMRHRRSNLVFPTSFPNPK